MDTKRRIKRLLSSPLQETAKRLYQLNKRRLWKKTEGLLDAANPKQPEKLLKNLDHGLSWIHPLEIEPSPELKAFSKEQVQKVLDGNLLVLGQPIERKRLSKSKMRNIAEKLGAPSDVFIDLEKYENILWLRDGFSKRDWPLIPSSGISPEEGMEIKFPWDLSRCHHFLFLALEGLQREMSLQALDWIVSNPLRLGPNWKIAMEPSIRLVNWMTAFSVLPPEEWIAPLVTASLKEHAEFIWKNLEFSPWRSGNHYLSNLLGLAYGSRLDHPLSETWRSFAAQEFVSEMSRTVYRNGADYEASSNYQHLVTEIFLLGTAELFEKEIDFSIKKTPLVGPECSPKRKTELGMARAQVFPEWYLSRLGKMCKFCLKTLRPDGTPYFYGDVDDGKIFNVPERILEMTSACLEGKKSFYFSFGVRNWPGGKDSFPAPEPEVKSETDDSGFYVISSGEVWAALVNNGVGINGTGGHSHADDLSFGLWSPSLKIIDPGTFVYTQSPILRNLFRSCSVHSNWLLEKTEPYDLSKMFEMPFFGCVEEGLCPTAEVSQTEIEASAYYPKLKRYLKRRVSFKRDLDKEATTGILLEVNGHFVAVEDYFTASEATMTFLSLGSVTDHLAETKGIVDIRVSEAQYAPSYGVLEACLKTEFVYRRRA